MMEALEFCAKHKLPFRFPKNIETVKRIMQVETVPAALLAKHEQAVSYAAALGVKLIDHLLTSTADFDELTGYEKLKNVYFHLISNLHEGVSEIFMHPSLESAPVGANNPKWPARVWEHQLLRDDDFAKHIEKEGISLIAYPEIP